METLPLSGTLESHIIPLSVITTESRWMVKVVASYFSFPSSLNLKLKLFQNMFYDSDIVDRFSLSKTKCSNFIISGLAPYYRTKLITDIKKCPYFTLHFDESINKVLQTEQMDAFFRYWCDQSNQVKARYLDSAFLNHPNTDHIPDGIDTIIKALNKESMIILSMDGPNTNWAGLRKIQDKRKNEGFSILEDIVSFGIHILCGALQSDVKESVWVLEKVLQSMWKYFTILLLEKTFTYKLTSLKILLNASLSHVGRRMKM